jgi:rhodanese-related sulfurtransferase
MKKRLWIITLVIFFMAGAFTTPVRAAEAPRIKKDELKAMLGDSDLVILDVRAQSDWKGGDSKIKGAVREDPESVKSWAGKYSKDKTFVLYCA